MSLEQIPQSAAEFGLDPTTGFLPKAPPLKRLPKDFDDWEDLALNLPKILAGDSIRKSVECLPPFPVHLLKTEQEWERAMTSLSYIGHAYVWTGGKPPITLPAVLAKPWYEVATHLERLPVLSYPSYCLHNWQSLDSNRPLEVGNIALIQNFFGGLDEEWFVLIHVDIEMKSAKGMNRLFAAQRATITDDQKALLDNFSYIHQSLVEMNATLERMIEGCDPYIYYHRVRPYIHGWKNHPDLPGGMIYEGVEAYKGVPQQFRGETGAQSAIVPALDGFLGVEHKADLLKEYLLEMRLYMPIGFRKFIEAVENGPSVRAYIERSGNSELVDAYDEALFELDKFRTKHLEYAAIYIYKQAQTSGKNPHAIGTGGTPFMPYLKKHRDETREHLMKA